MIEMVYNGFFGKGNNVNHYTLNQYGLFNDYPYNIKYTKNDFINILKLGRNNVRNTIID